MVASCNPVPRQYTPAPTRPDFSMPERSRMPRALPIDHRRLYRQPGPHPPGANPSPTSSVTRTSRAGTDGATSGWLLPRIELCRPAVDGKKGCPNSPRWQYQLPPTGWAPADSCSSGSRARPGAPHRAVDARPATDFDQRTQSLLLPSDQRRSFACSISSCTARGAGSLFQRKAGRQVPPPAVECLLSRRWRSLVAARFQRG